jgi:tetratricopeptide (TPR) repeat protein
VAREDDESDLFSTRPYDSGTSIPVIVKVPLTKEEIQRKRLLRITYAAIGVVTVAFLIWLAFYLQHAWAIERAVEAASSDGRNASIREAIELLEGEDDAESQAIQLRLRSMLVLSGEEEPTEPIATALAALPNDSDVQRERGIAETYLALARGDLAAARQKASEIVARGGYAAEAARARALAARFVGNVEQAQAAARIAVDLQPEAPRHVALLAELMARAGQTEQALARLDQLPDAAENAAVHIARARIMDNTGANGAQMTQLAQRVLEDEAATMHEKAWARLLLARAAAADGDRITARRHLDQASEVAPPGDELFTLGLTEAALRIDAEHLAQQVAQRLPSPLSVDAGRRAQLSAELALSRHDLRAAASAIEHCPAGARTSLARGRLLEARAQIDRARALYEEAAQDAGYRVPATVHLAAMELAQGNAAAAVERIAPMLEEHPNHSDVVPVAVEAQLGLRQPQRAMELVAPALDAHPEDVRLLGAKAHVQMALAQWEQALETLDTALRIQSDDADLHADRGRAARELSRLEVAREAYDAALALNESHPAALIGRLELDLVQQRPADGVPILERIDRAEVRSVTVERLRGRLLAMRVAGQSGVNAVRTAARDHADDYSIVMSLGWLYMQAEQYSIAVRTFGRVIQGDTPPLEAVLARVLAQVRMRAAAPARSALEAATEGLDETTLEPAVRAELHAVLGRIAQADDQRALAQQEAQRALEIDRNNSEAHLILADLLADREQDDSAELSAALVGPHPASRPLGSLAIREEQVNDTTCEYAERYRDAAPAGQYARGVARVLRDCRARQQ